MTSENYGYKSNEAIITEEELIDECVRMKMLIESAERTGLI